MRPRTHPPTLRGRTTAGRLGGVSFGLWVGWRCAARHEMPAAQRFWGGGVRPRGRLGTAARGGAPLLAVRFPGREPSIVARRRRPPASPTAAAAPGVLFAAAGFRGLCGTAGAGRAVGPSPPSRAAPAPAPPPPPATRTAAPPRSYLARRLVGCAVPL